MDENNRQGQRARSIIPHCYCVGINNKTNKALVFHNTRKSGNHSKVGNNWGKFTTGMVFFQQFYQRVKNNNRRVIQSTLTLLNWLLVDSRA